MAILKSIASGNLTAAATWGVIDSTSYNNTETAAHIVTTAYSGNRSASFTPGAITVSHIGIRLNQRTNTTGTFSIHIADNATFTEVAGTEVIINTADFPALTSASNLLGGWMFFKLASPVTLLAATAYVIECRTSSGSQIRIAIGTASTPSTMARALVTTATQAPVAGDDMNISGEYTGTGTSNSFTVIMNETASTDYGSASTNSATPAISISNKSRLEWATAAATNYLLKVSGHIVLYIDGSYIMGSVATPCPRDSTMRLTLDCVASGDFAIHIRQNASFICQGQSRTVGKNYTWCLLNTNEAVNSTSLGVDTDTGWLDNDQIAIAPTGRTANEFEDGRLNGNAGASTLTVDGFAGAGGGLAFAHEGTAPVQAEVVLLTRNVVIEGTSSTVTSYIIATAGSTNIIIDLDWVELRHLGVSNGRRGIYIDSSCTGTLAISYCSLHSCLYTTATTNLCSFGIGIVTGSASFSFSMNHTVTYNIVNITLAYSILTTPSSVDNCVFLAARRNGSDGGHLVSTMSPYGSFTNNRLAGTDQVSSRDGLNITSGDSGQFTALVDNCVIHSIGGAGITVSVYGVTISNCTIYRCNTASGSDGGITLGSAFDYLIDSCTLFGNNVYNIIIPVNTRIYNLRITNCILAGDSSFATTNGLFIQGASGSVSQGFSLVKGEIYNTTFGVASGIRVAHTNDINFSSFTNASFPIELTFVNCLFSSGVTVSNQSSLHPSGILGMQKFNQTVNSHRSYKKQGNLVLETGTVRTGTRSLAMKPLTATSTDKLVSNSFLRPVANGASLTPSVYVYEDGSYNGNRARLILKKNDAIGITSDTVIAVATAASDGAWEQLTGTTALATDNGVMEFVVDCDGTAGNLFVDDFSV